jgi:hypothetical protein
MSRTETNRIEELKAELSSVALRQEHQNRPVRLVIVTGLVLVASVIFLLVGVSKRFAAEAKLSRDKARATEMISLSDRLTKVKAAAANREGGGLGVPIEGIRSRIMAAGTEAGLKNQVPLPRKLTPNRGGSDAVQQRIEYEVRDESLDAIVRWIETAVRGTGGLEVYALTLRPEANQWNCKVTFSRWEWDKGT